MSLIVDTDVVSFTFKKDTRAALYESHLFGMPKLISFMTLAEVKRWTRLYNRGEKRSRELTKFLENFGVIYPEEKTCDLWAKVFTEAQQKGRPMSFPDSWVAATALQFDVPVVTHNRKHFETVENLKIISER